MIKKAVFLVMAAMVALTSCTERIDVELDSTYTRLVVDGGVWEGPAACRVSLSITADYFSNEPAPRVVNAVVTVTDGSTVHRLKETIPGTSGIYAADSAFTGHAGNTYTLRIELQEEISGTRNAEATCYLAPVTRLDSIGTEFKEEWGPDGIWMIRLWAQEPADEVNYYLFNYFRNGKCLSDTITQQVVSDDKFYNGSYMTGVDVIYINNENEWETLKPGDTVMLQMSGITKEYYDFVSQVQQAGFSIPFFSGPPANVQGNVSNGGVGFFSARSSSYATCVVR